MGKCKEMGTMNKQLQKYWVDSNWLDSSEEDFEVIAHPKMNIRYLYNLVGKSQMPDPGIVEHRFGNCIQEGYGPMLENLKGNSRYYWRNC